MNFLEYLRQFHPIDDSEYTQLTSFFKRRDFKKGELIICAGEIQRELYFVNKGVQMSFVDTAQKQHVIAFTYPPNICAIPESFLFQKPAPYNLISLTASECEAITFTELNMLFDRSQTMERLFRKMTEAFLVGVISRHIELHTLTIEERFKSFTRQSKHLLQLVPHKYIASYLGIDPTNFSKLYNSVKI
ncbi:MAG: Crp/Fnr family transcriptional regulator [Cyclobacteriaceae bacterium]|nr:Crp/Fnr family transcriptional regulator [Cyclobacteriaceae bacterium]